MFVILIRQIEAILASFVRFLCLSFLLYWLFAFFPLSPLVSYLHCLAIVYFHPVELISTEVNFRFFVLFLGMDMDG